MGNIEKFKGKSAVNKPLRVERRKMRFGAFLWWAIGRFGVMAEKARKARLRRSERKRRFVPFWGLGWASISQRGGLMRWGWSVVH